MGRTNNRERMDRDHNCNPGSPWAISERGNLKGLGRSGPSIRGQAPRSIGRTDNAEIGTEPMGGAPRAGFVLMEGPEQILRVITSCTATALIKVPITSRVQG